MIAIDTNILLRYGQRDDPVQSDLVARLFGALGPSEKAFVSREVLVEFVWVLRRIFGLPRDAIAASLEDVLQVEAFQIETVDDVAVALAHYRAGGDFADLLIMAASRRMGCDTLYTFDRKLARHEGVTLLEAS